MVLRYVKIETRGSNEERSASDKTSSYIVRRRKYQVERRRQFEAFSNHDGGGEKTAEHLWSDDQYLQ